MSSARVNVFLFFLSAVCFFCIQCSIGQGGKMTLAITSPAFNTDQLIPAHYTCEGKDTSPPLAFSGVPEGTKSLVLIVDDPDAPDPAAPKMTWIHWLLYNLPPDTFGLAEAAADLPMGTLQGVNDFKRTRYGGPCPPIGRHRYFLSFTPWTQCCRISISQIKTPCCRPCRIISLHIPS